MGGAFRSRLTSIPQGRTRSIGALPVLLVIASLVATCAGPTPSAPASGTTTASTGTVSQASATPGVTPLPTASPGTTAGWTPLELAALAPVASLEATRTGVASVAPSTAFRLTSLDGTPVRAVAARLVATPALELRVAQVKENIAVLQPAAPLRRGQVYRFELRRDDGTAAAAWAVQAAWPLKVASSLPGDGTSNVPRDTGIEVTFDQAGVKLDDLKTHLTIQPAIAGHFEQHGLTFVYVPTNPLAASTLYTVTVRHGLSLPGTGMNLERDTVIRFETTGAKVLRVHMTVARTLFDAGTSERPTMSVRLYAPDQEQSATETVKSLGVKVHRLPGLTAATDAYRRVERAPDWTVRTSTTPVKTASLPEVLEATVRLHPFNDGETSWFQLPTRLAAGWYMVTVTLNGISRQTVLQVTDLATFAMVSQTRSLVWVNDLRSNEAVSGARVSLGGSTFGRTDGEGLAVGRSPAPLLTDAQEGVASFAIVRSGGRAMFVPLDPAFDCYECDGTTGDSWWHLLTTDRSRYRASDTINVWGVLRNRDSNAVPASATVRLSANDLGGERPQPVVASMAVSPDASGAWLAHLSYTDLPTGDYLVSVLVGKVRVAQAWVSVGPILKPAWQIDLSTPHHAVLSGTSVPVTAVSTFFEGTPVAGADLRFASESDEDGTKVLATTDADGTATASPVLRLAPNEDNPEQSSAVSVYVRANEPEEGDISQYLPVMVFRSTALLDTDASLAGTRLTVKGAIHDVVFERYDAPGVDLSQVEPRGDPRAGARLTVRVTEVIPVRHRTGTTYDFIAKRTVPVYEVTERRVELGTRMLTTGADGRFQLSMAVKGGERGYEIRAMYTDEGGRTIASEASAWTRSPYEGNSTSVVSTATGESYGEYGVGARVSVRFRGGIPSPEVRRYLFAVTSRGIRSVSVQDGARFATRLTEELLPNARITGVRFTGTGYEVDLGGFHASFRSADRALQVQLSADRARYEPGGRATVSIRTLDAHGNPVAASVYVRTVDEKLFAIGAAFVDDPLDSLYSSTGSGVVAAAWSHLGPEPNYDGGKGDTTGDGDRDDFRDWLVARVVTTGADGRGSLSFDLSDDLTSWRVVASAVTPGLLAGAGSLSIAVGLPFFAEAVVAPEYLSVDRPVIRVRAYGSSLAASAPVTFTVSSDSLPMAAVTVQGTAFDPVEVTLPKLGVGTHRLRIQATTGTGSAQRSDSLIRTFKVVETRAIRSHTESVALVTGTTVGGGSGLTHVTIVDAGRGRVVPLLRELAVSEPFRADTAIAAAIARNLLAAQFGIPDDPGLPDPDLLPFQDGNGMSLVAWASEDLELSAMTAFSGTTLVDRDKLHWYFADYTGDEGTGAMPPDSELYLLLGRASLGESSISEVNAAAARADLTPPQRVIVALAALAVGDQSLATQVYRDLLGRYGERLGPWVRVNVGTPEQTAVATARLAIIAASLGDPIAADMDAEIVAHPPTDTVVDLDRAIAARYWAERMPKTTAVAAVTLDGKRTEVTTTADDPAVFSVTPAQRAGLRIDPVRGSVLVVSQWDGAVSVGDLTPPAGQAFTRTVAPAGTIGPTQTVVVSFQVTLGPNADDGCWQVTDFAPSGLAPIETRGRWEEDEQGTGVPMLTPWRVDGQRVDFCVTPDPSHPVLNLRYLARVVTPGSYRWESAVLQSSVVPEQGVVLPGFDVTIGGLGS